MKKSNSYSGRQLILVIFTASLLISISSCKDKKGAVPGQTKAIVEVAPDSLTGRIIVASLAVKPERIKDFIAAAGEMVKSSNAEPGCEMYQLLQDPYDPTRFVFLERYVNQAAVDVHFASSYFNAFGPSIKDMLKSPAEINIFSASEAGKK